MTHTVIGLFDNRNEANAAIEELTQNGFIRENIDLSMGRSTDTAATAAAAGTTPDTGVGDSISNFFSSLFGDETTARSYTDAARGAEGILTVQVDSVERAAQAAQILDRNGAVDVDERTAQYSQSNVAETGATAQTAVATEGETAIPIIEEELQVGKRDVERGSTRIRSRIVERPVEETLRLREEHVYVQRRPVNRAVTESDLTNFKEGEIEITEHAEEAVVAKQARVVEEVTVGKQVEERDQVIRDTVRHTEVDVEETGGVTTTTQSSEIVDDINSKRATS